MDLQTLTVPGAKVHMKFGKGSKLLNDYRFTYSYIGLSIPRTFKTMFPRTGFLIFNMFIGKDITTRFLNYERSVTQPNHLYISGLFSGNSLDVSHKGNGTVYAMKVHPVIGYHLLKVPMCELLNRQVRICQIIDLKDQFLEKTEMRHQINSFDDPYINEFFEKTLPPKYVYQNDPIYHAVNNIIFTRGLITVDKLAKLCFMSRRTLNRQFKLKVGLSPKRYAKIWQIQYAMELIRQNPNARLGDIAFKAGYYDVAHLARDFRTKVALPPSEFTQDINPLCQNFLDAPKML